MTRSDENMPATTRALRLFGDVRSNEGLRVIVLMMTVFLLLVGYYVIKTVREPLILASGGAELKAYAAAAQAAALVLVVPFYSWLTSAVGRRKLVAIVTIFFIACIQFFYFGSRMNRDQIDHWSPGAQYATLTTDELHPREPSAVQLVPGAATPIRVHIPGSHTYSLFIATPEQRDALPDFSGALTADEDTGLSVSPATTENAEWPDSIGARFDLSGPPGTYELQLRYGADVGGTVHVFTARKARWPWLGFAFYVWVGIFSLAIISLFWSWANDTFSRSDGERLFPIIAIGATAGAPLGSWLAARLFDLGINPFLMLQISALTLGLSLVLYLVSDRLHVATGAHRDSPDDGEDDELNGSKLGFDLVFQNKYLLMLAGLMLLLNLVNTNGEYILGKLVTNAAHNAVAASGTTNPDAAFAQWTGGFYGDFFFVVNIVSFVLQAFVVSRIVKLLGIRGVLLALPVIAFGVYGMAAAGVGLAAFRWGKTAENATDYSVMNTGKAMLWLPTSREEKFKAKQAIDTFFVRVGDLLSAGLVFVLAEQMELGVRSFAAVNLGLIAFWLLLTHFIVRRYQELSSEPEQGS